MANPNYNNTYEIEDTQTGKFYKVEGVDGTTREEAIQWLETLDEQALAQREIVQQAPQAPTTAAPAPAPQPQGVAPETALPEIMQEQTRNMTPLNSGTGFETQTTIEKEGRPDIANLANALWAQGERDPERFTQAIVQRFPELEGYQMTPGHIASLEERDKYYASQGQQNPGNFTANTFTGLEDPEAPEGVLETLGTSAQRGLANMANSLTGGAALVTGSDELLEKYVEDQQKINFNYKRPEGAESIQDVDSFGDVAEYAADTLGELAPQITSSLGFGYLGGKAAQLTTRAALGRAATEKGVRIGQTAAVTANSIAQETGNTYGQTYMATGEKAPISSLLAGVASGSLEAILPMRALSRMGVPTKDLQANIMKRMAREGGKDFFVEGATEAAQTFIQSLPESVVTGESPFTQEMMDGMIDSFFRGGLGGGTVGAVTGATQRRDYQANEPYIRVPSAMKKSGDYKQQLSEASQDIATVINETTSKWKQDTLPNTVVHDNFKDLKGVDNNAVGVYMGDGQIAVNTENVIKKAKKLGVTPDAVVNAMLFHESLGHYGLDTQFGAKLDDQLLDWYDQNESFREDVDKWLKAHPKAYLRQDRNYTRARAAEEVLAQMSEPGQRKLGVYDTLANLVKNFARQMGWDLDVSYREIKSMLALSHSRVGETDVGTRILQRLNPKQADETATDTHRYMYVGKGAENADLDTLQRLEDELTFDKMSGVGEADLIDDYGPGSENREEFGWFKAPDGRWRFEIDDNKSSFRQFDYMDNMDEDQLGFVEAMADYKDLPMWEVSNDVEGKTLFELIGDPKIQEKYDMNSAKLGDLVEHTELFEAYPELADVQITREPSRSWGAFYPGTKRINIAPDAPDPKGVLFHEVQHWVQDKEGFASGGNTQSVLKHTPDDLILKGSKNLVAHKKEEAKKELRLAKVITKLADDPLSERLYKVNNETERFSDLADAARKKGQEEKSKEFRTKMLDSFKLGKELRAQFVRDNFGITYDNMIMKDENNELAAEFRELDRVLHGADKYSTRSRDIRINEFQKKAKRRMDDVKPWQKMVDDGDAEGLRFVLRFDDDAKYSSYKHLFGEVEARDTQMRYDGMERAREVGDQDMLDYGRQDIEPYSLEPDIDPESYIFTYDTDGTSESAPDNKYMMLEDIEPINPEDLTADELFEAENAVDILRAATQNYEGETIPIDDLRTEAEARGVTASQFLRSKAQNPGDLARRILMLDIASEKLAGKLGNLYAKLQSGEADPNTKGEYLKTLAQYQELTERIMTEQAEVGRALRATRDVNFTKRRAKEIQRILGSLQNSMPDDESFFKFAKDLDQNLKDQQKESALQKGSRIGANALNFPRALMSSLDLSAPLRQGIFLIGRKEFWTALPTMFKAFGSEETYNDLMRNISRRPTYEAMLDAKIAFSTLDGKLSNREEDFMTQWADAVPGVRRSNRAYTSFLNKLRADAFDSIFNMVVESETKNGGESTFAKDTDQLRLLGSFINNATGRGDLGKFLNSAAPQLTTMLFSPRLIAARVGMLSMMFRPSFWTKTHPIVRREAIRSLLTFTGTALLVLTLAGMAGAEIEEDMRSSDFGKIRIGDTRYDILGGFGQYMVLGARLLSWSGGSAYEAITGEEGPYHFKSSGTGNMSKLNEGTGEYDQTADKVSGRFIRSKLAPVPAYIKDAFAGENVIGEEVNPADMSRFLPMFWQDFYETTKEYGIGQGALMSAPAFFGVGAQTYKPKATDPYASIEAPETFDMSDLEDGENDDIVAKDGVVTVKPHVQEAWTARINELVEVWMADEMAAVDWESLSGKEQAEIIKEVRSDARAQARKEIKSDLGLD